MSKLYILPTVSILSLLLAGCGTTPENPTLVKAREGFSALQGKPESSRIAALETQEASVALTKAEQASLKNRKGDDVEQLSYLANNRVKAAEETIKLRLAQAGMKNIEAERTQARLDVRSEQLKAALANNAPKGSKETERGTVVTFGDVLFATGQATLNPRSRDNIQELGRYLRDNPSRRLLVEGHTDSTGGDALNQRLSEARAASVANALRREGIAANRIVTAGYGKDYPVASNASAHSRQLNRRVEVIISRDDQEVVRRR